MKEKLIQIFNQIFNPTITIIWTSIGLGTCILLKQHIPRSANIIITISVIFFGSVVFLREIIKRIRKK